MLLHIFPFAGMIALSILYFRELGWGTIGKYWAAFLVLAFVLPFMVHAPFTLGILKWAVVFMLYAKALFSNSSTLL